MGWARNALRAIPPNIPLKPREAVEVASLKQRVGDVRGAMEIASRLERIGYRHPAYLRSRPARVTA